MLNLPTDKTKFESQLRKIWFDLYNNYFGDISVRDASGFEHIFVGEGKYDFANPINNKILGAISGYHSWVKFYLDEKQQQVNYLGQAFPALQRRGLRLTAFRGHNYDLQGNIGVDNPYVVTVQMLWQQCHYAAWLCDRQNNLEIALFKKKGCFFIGTSPECDIAMGTVAYYESLANYKFNKEKRRITINGAMYDLALYRNIQQDGSRGDRIRSFYPVYLGEQKKS